MVKKLANYLFSVQSSFFYSIPIYVFEKDNGLLTIIDTGFKKDINTVIKKIRKKWGSIQKIERIILTHRHIDHIGGLRRLIDDLTKNESSDISINKIEIICHKDEEELLIKEQGENPIKPNRLVKHDEIIDKGLGLKAIHIPGHTFGHICILAEKHKILLLGDSIMYMFFKLRPVFKRFHDDYNLYLKKLPKILDYEWDFAFPAHNKSIKIPREKINRFIVNITKDQD